VALVAVSSGSYYAGLQQVLGGRQIAPDPQVQSQFKVFWEAWNLVESDYVDESTVDEREMTYGAIQGMLSSLDDANTRFSDPVDAVHVEEHIRGSFDGIGVRVELRDGRMTVVAPLEDSPGEKAGLRGGDVITHVNGEDITKHTLNESVRLIRGPRGTKVTLTIERQGQPPFDVEIIRAEIKIISVRGEMLGDIAYLKLNNFNANSSDQLTSKVEELLAEDPVGLILDLRNNPGGLLSSAVHVTSQFLSSGVVLREERRDADPQVFAVQSGGIATEIPMVVLVNSGSASASEIVAGALQDTGRAIIIGEKTFGKGTVQTINRLSDGSILHLTIARWSTPDDRLIEKVGLEPDIVIELTDDDRASDRDPQLERAKQHLHSMAATGGDNATPSPVKS
jgi:carboxyl-terminal processing protease